MCVYTYIYIYIYICITESLGCTAEMNTTLQINYTLIIHTHIYIYIYIYVEREWENICCSVAKSCPTLQSHGLRHARLPCPSASPEACLNLYPLSQWCHQTVSSSVVPFSSCFQSFLASGSFPVSQLFASGDQSIGASALASVLPMSVRGWFPLNQLCFNNTYVCVCVYVCIYIYMYVYI